MGTATLRRSVSIRVIMPKMMWAVVIMAVGTRGASVNASFENHSHILVTTHSGVFIAALGVDTYVANNCTTDPLSRVT